MPDINVDVVAIALAAFGLIALFVALRRLFRARVFAATRSALTGILLLACAGALIAVSATLHTYARLTHEAPVAELVFEATGPQRFRATLTRVSSGNVQTFDLNGDEWQLDARVLKWRGWANTLGLDARYQLERVSGRFRDIAQEKSEPRTVYALAEPQPVDLWLLSRAYPKWLPFVDAIYGNATYLPMADGARYRVTISQTGLVARPLNPAAEVAVGLWQ